MADYSNNIIRYSNQAYAIVVTLYPDVNMPSKLENALTLDAQTIEEIEYSSELNDLILRARITYIDKYGQVDKFIEQRQCYCDIMFGETKKKSDGDFSNNDIDYKRCFMHSFIVNQISIVGRSTSFIKYQLELVSMNWYNCIANIAYSNNDKDPEPILDIIKACITQQGLAVDDDTFKNVKSNVKMNYISKLNDSLFTLVPYLLHKLYFLPSRDDSVKFIYYDWLNRKYKVLDLADNKSILNCSATALSFFKSNAEMLIQQDPTNIGSFVNSIGNINEYKNLFSKDMFSYDITTNEFNNLNVDAKSIVQYMNNHMSYDDYAPKYHEIDAIKTLKYFQSSSYWNATLNVYNDSVYSIEQNGAIVLNVTGDITRQCGSMLTIGLDRDMNALTDDSRDELEKMKTKYKMFEGPWIASKVVSIINPQKQIFRQKVALFRNCMMKIQKPKDIMMG